MKNIKTDLPGPDSDNKKKINTDTVYKRLALLLDQIPNGYPATESGIEIKILEKLLTPEEAELACHLTTAPESANSVAGRLNREERDIFAMLKAMTKKGFLEMERGEKSLCFKLIPFIVGFFENQNKRLDQEFAELFEGYYKEGLHRIMSYKPSVHRVIPIEKTIPVNVEVMPYERASTYLDNANSWGVLRCICRVQKRLIGEGCHHSEDNCLAFSEKTDAFKRASHIRALTKDEALQLLADANSEGLVHTINMSWKEVTYICNCCGCSCGILRGIAEYGHLNAVGRSSFYVTIDEDGCTGCSVCIDRCQFKALSIGEDGNCSVDLNRCYGCGLCVPTCPTDALSLNLKPEEELEPPPASESEWLEQRAKSRGL